MHAACALVALEPTDRATVHSVCIASAFQSIRPPPGKRKVAAALVPVVIKSLLPRPCPCAGASSTSLVHMPERTHT